MLTFAQIRNDLYRMAGTDPNRPIRDDLREAVRIAILNAQQNFALWGDWDFLEKYQRTVYLPLIAPYSTGTVTLTNGLKTVIGLGTAWTTNMEGSYFVPNGMESYEIFAVDSPTQITLMIPFQGTSAGGLSHQILKRFYDLPLDFLRVGGTDTDAILQIPGTTSERILTYRMESGFEFLLNTGTPMRYCALGNTRGRDYFNTGTVTIVTVGTTSTWTISSGVLPTDIVDREVRVGGEDRAYRIYNRVNGTQFTTYQTYVNPLNQTSALAIGGAYAITPKDTQQIGFDIIPDKPYIFKMPYTQRLPEMLLDLDISPVALAGYDRALKAACRYELSLDARVALRADIVQNLARAYEESMQIAWSSEQYAASEEEQAESSLPPLTQTPPSWFK